MKKVILFILVFISQFISAQCAMCKAVVENGDAEIAEGINNGITYLMIFPYLLIGVLFFTLYRYRKKTKN
jgi:heme/copper-type cytochrome/quinol oxidase subunit 2